MKKDSVINAFNSILKRVDGQLVVSTVKEPTFIHNYNFVEVRGEYDSISSYNRITILGHNNLISINIKDKSDIRKLPAILDLGNNNYVRITVQSHIFDEASIEFMLVEKFNELVNGV